jgi:hypothetical protein
VQRTRRLANEITTRARKLAARNGIHFADVGAWHARGAAVHAVLSKLLVDGVLGGRTSANGRSVGRSVGCADVVQMRR